MNPDMSLKPRATEIQGATAEQRFLSPSEIGPHVVYLADSQRSPGINGCIYRLDAGFGIVNLPLNAYEPRAKPHP